MGTHGTIIGKYERNEVKPSIEVAKKIADLYGVSLDFLMAEDDSIQPIKDKQMIERISEIERLNEKDRAIILHTVDALIREAKTRQAFA
jgi:transcriptional regulator with XRE-family HTH domain